MMGSTDSEAGAVGRPRVTSGTLVEYQVYLVVRGSPLDWDLQLLLKLNFAEISEAQVQSFPGLFHLDSMSQLHEGLISAAYGSLPVQPSLLILVQSHRELI